MKSFYYCSGIFGDTFHLELDKHKNYQKFRIGKCSESANMDDYSIDEEYAYVARYIYIGENETFIGHCFSTLYNVSL